jgi:hypothetical protein
VAGAVTGALGGAALGLALEHWKKTMFLALSGMALFVITHQILYNRLLFDAWNLFSRLPIEAAITGVVLGATMGYLEKRAN